MTPLFMPNTLGGRSMARIRFQGEVAAARTLTRAEGRDLLDRIANVLAFHTGRVVSASSDTLGVEFTHWPLVSNWDVMAGVTRGELHIDTGHTTLHYTFDQSSFLTAVQVGAPVFFAVLMMVLASESLLGALAFMLLGWIMFFFAYLLSASRIRSLIKSVVASA
jgi:hypothetical protein